MMDYTKQCWNCGKVTVEAEGSYYRCKECGATWNETRHLEPSPVAAGSVSFTGSDGQRHRESSPKPSKSAVVKARKRREGR